MGFSKSCGEADKRILANAGSYYVLLILSELRIERIALSEIEITNTGSLGIVGPGMPEDGGTVINMFSFFFSILLG
jgi:hypothetical protein